MLKSNLLVEKVALNSVIMEDLSEYTSPVIEFKATHTAEKQLKLTDNSTTTDPLPIKVDSSAETNPRCSQETQTDRTNVLQTNVDDRLLAMWLRKIFPRVEQELLKGCTPVFNAYTSNAISFCTGTEIQQYQKLALESTENSQGLGTWLAVQTNSAPALVLSTIPPHDDWCEHVDQSFLRLYVPKREQNGNFVTWRDAKSIPIKACLRSLCTNTFNKSMFAGSTLDGDIYVWHYELNVNNSVEVNELYNTTLVHGYAVAMDWTNEQTLLTAHSNGHVVQWRLAKEFVKEAEFLIKPSSTTSMEICCLLALNLHDFVVGCKDGSIYHCWISSSMTMKRHLEIIQLKTHRFMTSSLLKANFNGHTVVISCDLSGEVYFHDLRNADDDTDTVISQIPLPFKNVIACTQDGSLIYSPGDDGSLECYRLRDGVHFTIKGALRGRGNFIKSSDNGCWIVTGLYDNEFQIFSIENYP